MAQPTINVSAFLPLVQPHVPHASYPAMMQSLREAAIEFCEMTRCWRHMITTVMEAQAETVIAPDFAAIHEFELVTFDSDLTLTPIQYSDLDLADFSEEGVPRYVTQTGPNRVSILPFKQGTLDISVFLKPRHGTSYGLSADQVPQNAYDEVPEFLLTLHGEVIAHGALKRLLMLPGQSFTDPQKAQYYQVEFQRRAEGVFNHNVRGQHRARPRIRASFF